MSPKPNIHVFNPTCDFAIGNGHVSWRPNLLLQQFEKDLDILPAIYAEKGDVVLVKRSHLKERLLALEKLGIDIPEMLEWGQINRSDFVDRPKNKLIPWGWSPVVYHQLKHLIPSCSKAFRESSVSHWEHEKRKLYSREFAATVLIDVLGRFKEKSILIAGDQKPQICQSEKEVVSAHNRWGRTMFKAPWSSSGRGIQAVWEHPIHPSLLNWCIGIIKRQGAIMAEPLLNKVADLAFEFEINEEKISFLGIHWFQTNEKGAYDCSFINEIDRFIAPEVLNFVARYQKNLEEVLSLVLWQKLKGQYVGKLGVDMLVFRDDNMLKLHPCIEINLRNTMGMVAATLAEKSPDRYSIFAIKSVDEILGDDCIVTPIYEHSVFCAVLRSIVR